MSYAIKYRSTTKSYTGKSVLLNIYKKDYTGGVIPLKLAENGIKIRKGKQGDDMFYPVKSTAADITLMSEFKNYFSEFYDADNRDYYLTIQVDGIIKFQGYLQTDIYNENYTNQKYFVSITAIDGLKFLNNEGGLKLADSDDLTDTHVVGLKNYPSLASIFLKVVSIIKSNILKPNILSDEENYIFESSHIWPYINEDLDPYYYYGDSPFRNINIDNDFLDIVNNDYNFMVLGNNGIEMLEHLLRPFALRIFQKNGHFHIASINHLGAIEYRYICNDETELLDANRVVKSEINTSVIPKVLSSVKNLSFLQGSKNIIFSFDPKATNSTLLANFSGNNSSFNDDETLKYWTQIGTKMYDREVVDDIETLKINNVIGGFIGDKSIRHVFPIGVKASGVVDKRVVTISMDTFITPTSPGTIPDDEFTRINLRIRVRVMGESVFYYGTGVHLNSDTEDVILFGYKFKDNDSPSGENFPSRAFNTNNYEDWAGRWVNTRFKLILDSSEANRSGTPGATKFVKAADVFAEETAYEIAVEIIEANSSTDAPVEDYILIRNLQISLDEQATQADLRKRNTNIQDFVYSLFSFGSLLSLGFIKNPVPEPTEPKEYTVYSSYESELPAYRKVLNWLNFRNYFSNIIYETRLGTGVRLTGETFADQYEGQYFLNRGIMLSRFALDGWRQLDSVIVKAKAGDSSLESYPNLLNYLSFEVSAKNAKNVKILKYKIRGDIDLDALVLDNDFPNSEFCVNYVNYEVLNDESTIEIVELLKYEEG